jgi:hypothetical protein
VKHVSARLFPATIRTVAVVLVLCWASVATADNIRYPQTGPVAFIIQLANGWTASADPNALNLIAPDKSSAITLTVKQQELAMAFGTSDQFANAAFKAANATFTKKEQASIGGIAAEAYFGTFMNSNNVPLVIEIVVIKRLSLVAESIISEAQLNDAQNSSLAAMLRGISVTGLN